MAEVMYPWVAPFVCEVPVVPFERRDRTNLYAAEQGAPAPAIVFVHGGPLPPLPVPPQDWLVYRGYGALAAQAGLVGVTVEHALHGSTDYSAAFADVSAAIDAVRTDSRVDATRIAVWAFSGGAPVMAPFMHDPPAWLMCVALTYPILDDVPGRSLPDGFRPIEVVDGSCPPVVATRVGHEAPAVAAGVARFLARAEAVGVAIDVLDVPDGEHGFDALPPVVGAGDAVHDAVERVAVILTR